LRRKILKSRTGINMSEEQKYNQSLATIKSGQAKEVEVFDFYTNKHIGKYHSVAWACRELGISIRNTKPYLVLSGKRNRVRNFVFKYTNN
jgi:hypothetical protein